MPRKNRFKHARRFYVYFPKKGGRQVKNEVGRKNKKKYRKVARYFSLLTNRVVRPDRLAESRKVQLMLEFNRKYKDEKTARSALRKVDNTFKEASPDEVTAMDNNYRRWFKAIYADEKVRDVLPQNVQAYFKNLTVVDKFRALPKEQQQEIIEKYVRPDMEQQTVVDEPTPIRRKRRNPKRARRSIPKRKK